MNEWNQYFESHNENPGSQTDVEDKFSLVQLWKFLKQCDVTAFCKSTLKGKTRAVKKKKMSATNRANRFKQNVKEKLPKMLKM